MTILPPQQVPMSLFAAERTIHEARHVEHSLRELVCLRISQLNSCHYCIDMHTKECTALGVPPAKLVELSGWSESQRFDSRERAALSLAEHSVRLERHDTSAIHRSSTELGHAATRELIVIIGMIHMWNRFAILASWEPGRYRAGDLERQLERL